MDILTPIQEFIFELQKNPTSLFCLLPLEIIQEITNYLELPGIYSGSRYIILNNNFLITIFGLEKFWYIYNNYQFFESNQKLEIIKSGLAYDIGIFIDYKYNPVIINLETNKICLNNQDYPEKIKFATGNSNQIFLINQNNQVLLLDRDKPQNIPKKLNLDNIKYITCGLVHIIFLDFSGKAYLSGNNHFGQLGPSKIISDFQELEFPEKIIRITSGYFHTIILTETSVYGLGLNSSGQIGLSQDILDINIPTKLNLPKIKNIFCGNLFSIFLSWDYQVYFCGYFISKSYFIPKIINWLSDKKIINIACGSDFFIMLDQAGNIYGYGDGYSIFDKPKQIIIN